MTYLKNALTRDMLEKLESTGELGLVEEIQLALDFGEPDSDAEKQIQLQHDMILIAKLLRTTIKRIVEHVVTGSDPVLLFLEELRLVLPDSPETSDVKDKLNLILKGK